MKILHKSIQPERLALSKGNFYSPFKNKIGPGMNEIIQYLEN